MMNAIEKTVETQEFCSYYKPTAADRFWRWAGYQYHHGGDEPEPRNSAWAGWMKSETRFTFSFADRLRLLLTGQLVVAHVCDIDTPSPDKIFTRVDWHIIAPHQRS